MSSTDLRPSSFRNSKQCGNLFPATWIILQTIYCIVNACATFGHIHIKLSTSGFDENQQTYMWILYTLANVTQLGPVDHVQLNIKLVTDWVMEDGAALGRRLCGRNDTPLVTVSEVNDITLSNSELASRISFIFPPSSLHLKSFPQPTATSADF